MTTLSPINTIIKKARQSGIAFGSGDPKTRLAYLTRLQLLPQAIRRKVNGAITGCYPETILETLTKIEKLRDTGLSYSQIKFQLQSAPLAPAPANNYSVSSFNLVFLLVGFILGLLISFGGVDRNQKLSAAPDQSEVALSNSTTAQILKEAGKDRTNQPIYVISLPDKNLYRLGQTNINSLFVPESVQ